MKQLDYILAHETETLNFLKSRYPIYHLSNVFFRDIQYGIQAMLYQRKMSVGYVGAERIARAFVAQLEKKKVLNAIDQQSWVVNYPEFKKPTVAPATAAKPAAKPVGPAAAAPGAAKPSLPPLSRPAAGAPKPGGLPPLSRPAPGAATAKPGGLPPLKSKAAAPSIPTTPPATSSGNVEAPKPVAATPTPAAQPSAPDAPAATPPPVAANPLGGKRPLPPLRSATKK